MQRPTVLRRLRATAVDRRIAAGGFSVATIVLLCAVVLTHAPLPAIDVPDPHAASELVTLLRAGERGSWSATYEFTRKLANGRVLRARMQEARRPSLHVLVSGASMTFERGSRSFDCNLVDERSACLESATGGDLSASEVMRVAIAIGAYRVTRLPDAVIAGARTRCFLVRATGHGLLPDLGVENRTCLTSDGVALSQLVVRATGDVDVRVAIATRPHPSERAVLALARSFDPKGTIPGG